MAESSAVKLAKKDAYLGYNIGKPLYSNQFIPLTTKADMFDRLRLQGMFDSKFSGGAIAHINVGEPIKDTDTIHDSILVVLPYEHHQADLEDVATVWYSGYDTKIDSALVYKHHTTQIIHQPYEVFKTPRLTVDLGVGNHQWKQLDPYVFARATVNVSNWKIEPYAGYSYSRQAMFGISVSKSFVLIK